LRLEKLHAAEKKKTGGGARSKANTNSTQATIIRVLFNDQEVMFSMKMWFNCLLKAWQIRYNIFRAIKPVIR